MGSRRCERGRIRLALVAIVVLALSLSISARASAKARSFALSWPAPAAPACIEQDALREAVVQRLGRDPFVAGDRADVVLHGRELPAKSGRLRARVEQRDREGRLLGSRDLDASSCADLKRSTVFVVVLIVDPDALLEAPAPVDSPPPAEPPPHALRASPEPRRTEPPAPRKIVLASRSSWLRADVGVGASVSSGLLPGGDAGPLVRLGVSPLRALRFEWRGGYRVALGAPRGRAFSALAQEWRACFVLPLRGPFGATACGGAAWTSIFPGTQGLAEGDQAAKSVFAPTVALGPTLKLGPLDVFADVSLLFPRPRYAFSYRDDEDRRTKLYEVDRMVFSAAIGVSRSF